MKTKTKIVYVAINLLLLVVAGFILFTSYDN